MHFSWLLSADGASQAILYVGGGLPALAGNPPPTYKTERAAAGGEGTYSMQKCCQIDLSAALLCRDRIMGQE